MQNADMRLECAGGVAAVAQWDNIRSCVLQHECQLRFYQLANVCWFRLQS